MDDKGTGTQSGNLQLHDFEIRKPGEISHVKGKQSPLFGTDGEEHKNVSYNLVFIPTYQHKYTVAKDLD